VTGPAEPDEVLGGHQAGSVEIQNVTRRFGDVVAVDDTSLQIRAGEFVSLLGPSGCGKTTLMRIIAGLERADTGTISVGGRDITRDPAHRRPVNMVFQRYALFPHMTVAENVGFGLRLRRTGREEKLRRVEAMLELVQLPGYGVRSIEQLSGGQAQRVALARALINNPAVLLLDEPLAALDLKLRQTMQLELREIQQRLGSTFVYVTHDQEEALVMSDRIVLMNGGRIIQDGTPRGVYDRPATLFASTFLGEANLFHGIASRGPDGRMSIESNGVTLLVDVEGAAPGETRVCIRPERIQLSVRQGERPAANAIDGVVRKVIFLGPVIRYIVTVADGATDVLVERAATEGTDAREGDRVRLTWSTSSGVIVTQ
jgi:spermidine/putrescine transport system ATP-binding protein